MKTPFETYGVECGSGWRELYKPLMDLCKLRGIQVMQIKEKFGGLRFYTGPVSEGVEDISLLIEAAEAQSLHTCEECGEHGSSWHGSDHGMEYKATTKGSETSGWIRTLCQPCREKFDAGQKIEQAEQRARLDTKKEKNDEPISS